MPPPCTDLLMQDLAGLGSGDCLQLCFLGLELNPKGPSTRTAKHHRGIQHSPGNLCSQPEEASVSPTAATPS